MTLIDHFLAISTNLDNYLTTFRPVQIFFDLQVSLKRATGSHFCGGSIINTNKVMCAAHCKQSSNNFKAGAGSVSLNSQRQEQSISSQAAHPQYNSRLIDYDYMVITTQGTWNYDQYVAPIKIVNPSTSELPNGTACQTSGYGYSQHIGGQPGKSNFWATYRLIFWFFKPESDKIDTARLTRKIWK